MTGITERLVELAESEGWTVDVRCGHGVFLVRDVEPSDALVRAQRAAGVAWQARERVFVTSDSGGRRVTFGSWATPRNQESDTGAFRTYRGTAVGPGKREQVIAWLKTPKGQLP